MAKGLGIRTINGAPRWNAGGNGNLKSENFLKKVVPRRLWSEKAAPLKLHNKDRRVKVYQAIYKEMT